MAKDTVRYPDDVVTEIDALVDDGMFESKSEFYRFSAEYVLTLIDSDHDIKTFNFDERSSPNSTSATATTPKRWAPTAGPSSSTP